MGSFQSTRGPRPPLPSWAQQRAASPAPLRPRTRDRDHALPHKVAMNRENEISRGRSSPPSLVRYNSQCGRFRKKRGEGRGVGRGEAGRARGSLGLDFIQSGWPWDPAGRLETHGWLTQDIWWPVRAGGRKGQRESGSHLTPLGVDSPCRVSPTRPGPLSGLSRAPLFCCSVRRPRTPLRKAEGALPRPQTPGHRQPPSWSAPARPSEGPRHPAPSPPPPQCSDPLRRSFFAP